MPQTGGMDRLFCIDVARERGEEVEDGYLPATCCGSCHEDGDRFEVVLRDGRVADVCCWQLDRMEDAGQCEPA